MKLIDINILKYKKEVIVNFHYLRLIELVADSLLGSVDDYLTVGLYPINIQYYYCKFFIINLAVWAQ